ncbi:MAG: NAD-dependent epimerase/dehydratase family protein, partial [SAR324 cluster bacterium]|nr:NAD-dependent epimerase/dehydratase family protein [SAR324 cluster bacterium]
MKILITGGAGFIGSNLVYHLSKQRPSWKLHVLDALTYAGNLENLASLLNSKSINFHKVDICDAKAIDALFEKEHFDIVFH